MVQHLAKYCDTRSDLAEHGMESYCLIRYTGSRQTWQYILPNTRQGIDFQTWHQIFVEQIFVEHMARDLASKYGTACMSQNMAPDLLAEHVTES